MTAWASRNLLDSLGKEGPGLTRRPVIPIVVRVSDVVTAVGNPPYRVAVIALVLGLDVLPRSGLRLRGILLLTAVEAKELVAELAAHLDVEDRIDNAVNAKVRDGSVAAVTTAQLGTSNRSNSSENICGRPRLESYFIKIAMTWIEKRNSPGRAQATANDMPPP